MQTRHGVLIAALFSLLMTACGNPSSQELAGSPTPGKLDYSGIHRIYDRPQVRGGHPLTVFVGAQYCPYCASMRWPLVEALSRFGSFTGLRQVSSKAGYEGFPSIATYDFSHASYYSDYVTFTSAEIADVSGTPLQSLDDDQTDLVNTSIPAGRFPSCSWPVATRRCFPSRHSYLSATASRRSRTRRHRQAPGRSGGLSTRRPMR